MLSEPPISIRASVHPAKRTGTRRWRDKFREAYRGIKLGMRGHSSFSVHFFAAAGALATCVALDCRLVEWCLILLCIGFVFVAELFNSAIETLFHGLDAETRSRWNGSLSIAAGAVLMASLFAVAVGGIVFVNRFGELMRWWG
jgi:diacylglycerol kinase